MNHAKWHEKSAVGQFKFWVGRASSRAGSSVTSPHQIDPVPKNQTPISRINPDLEIRQSISENLC
ncbi:MAG: hypothetical protein ACREDQ_12140, partial [Limisphaerales bacterium]